MTGSATACAAVAALLCAALVLTGLTAAQAAPSPAGAATRLTEAAPRIQPVAAVGDDEAACSRARRRLWITGEGWVVRRIKTCH